MHSNFKEINDRLWIMGDYAESAFKQYAAAKDISFIHFGMNRPPFDFFTQLPRLMRAMPDFLCETGDNRFGQLLRKQAGDISRANPPRHFFVEVKGCGADATFKLKDEQLAELRSWQQIAQRPVVFFFYDQPNELVSFSLSLDALDQVLPSLDRGAFIDNGRERPFSKLRTDHPLLEWEELWQYQHDGSLTSTGAS